MNVRSDVKVAELKTDSYIVSCTRPWPAMTTTRRVARHESRSHVGRKAKLAKTHFVVVLLLLCIQRQKYPSAGFCSSPVPMALLNSTPSFSSLASFKRTIHEVNFSELFSFLILILICYLNSCTPVYRVCSLRAAVRALMSLAVLLCFTYLIACDYCSFMGK